MVNLLTNVAEYAIILNEKNEFILVQWGEEFGSSWHFPGGRMDNGEKATQGLLREVREELSAQIVDIKPACTHNIFGDELREPNMEPRYGIFYFAKLSKRSQLKIDNDEHVAYKWFSRKDLPTIKFWLPFYRKLLEDVLPK